LTDEEINAHFTFDLPLNRAVLIDTLPDFYYGRYYGGGNFKKVFSLGEVPFHIFGDAGETLVVVEDPISAIVVSRSYACLPLFGSHLFNDWLSKLTFTGYRKIVFWLDSDKAHEGLKYALSLRHLYKTGWIHSLQDPKLYSESQVEDFVGGVGKTVNICV
jgi:hypothetical protein